MEYGCTSRVSISLKHSTIAQSLGSVLHGLVKNRVRKVYHNRNWTEQKVGQGEREARCEVFIYWRPKIQNRNRIYSLPVMRKTIIFCMIEELNQCQYLKSRLSQRQVKEVQTRGYSPRTWYVYKEERIWGCCMIKLKNNTHFPLGFPCINKKGWLDFHWLNLLPWKNPRVIPLWWALDMMLWLIDGPRGESHWKRLFLSWFSMKLPERPEQWTGNEEKTNS